MDNNNNWKIQPYNSDLNEEKFENNIPKKNTNSVELLWLEQINLEKNRLQNKLSEKKNNLWLEQLRKENERKEQDRLENERLAKEKLVNEVNIDLDSTVIVDNHTNYTEYIKNNEDNKKSEICNEPDDKQEDENSYFSSCTIS